MRQCPKWVEPESSTLVPVQKEPVEESVKPNSRSASTSETSELVLPKVNYFQVIFTLPDRLSGLILGNRRELYDLLFHAAWRSLKEAICKVQKFQPAAQFMLHT